MYYLITDKCNDDPVYFIYDSITKNGGAQWATSVELAVTYYGNTIVKNHSVGKHIEEGDLPTTSGYSVVVAFDNIDTLLDDYPELFI